MTPTQRRAYSRKYQQMLKAFEVKHAGPVYRALRKQVVEFADVLERAGANAAMNQVHLTLFNPHLQPVITDLYTEAGLMMARQVRGELRMEEQKRFGYNQEFIDRIIDYLNRYLLDKSVRPISQTTREWALGVISKGQEEGTSIEEIARILRDGGLADSNGVTFLRYQALRVVRTETLRATNVGAIKAAETSPFAVTKQWIAAHDARTRHSHKLVDGTVLDMGDKFSVQRWRGRNYLGNEPMSQPGDPEASAENIIQCRCTVAIRAKRDERGRLTR
jgi:hypothetical protein